MRSPRADLVKRCEGSYIGMESYCWIPHILGRIHPRLACTFALTAEKTTTLFATSRHHLSASLAVVLTGLPQGGRRHEHREKGDRDQPHLGRHSRGAIGRAAVGRGLYTGPADGPGVRGPTTGPYRASLGPDDRGLPGRPPPSQLTVGRRRKQAIFKVWLMSRTPASLHAVMPHV